MLNPLLMMLVLTAVFSSMMQRDVEHYPVFLFSAMLPWTFFSTTLQGSLRSISRNAKIFGQIPVPKYLFILSLTLSNLYNFIITLLPFVVIALIVGHPLHWTLLLLPICFLPLLAITVGASLFLATLNVFFEDIEHLTTVLIRGLYFLCPIIYPVTMLSEQTRAILEYNPLFSLIVVFRDVMYFGNVPSLQLFGVTGLASLVVLYLGFWIFKRAEHRMVYFV
jgi:ABC-type polysaccharide/polyol phosphate export permease